MRGEDMTEYVEEFQEPREEWLWRYFNWVDEKDIAEAEKHTARDGFDAGATWADKQRETSKQRVRNAAWAGYKHRKDCGWTEDQQKCFMAGMAVMWRLFALDNGPLFTYGEDRLPKELTFKYEIGQICEVTLEAKFSGEFGVAFNKASIVKRGGPDLVKVIGRITTDSEPEYELVPYPEQDDLPDDYSRSLYEKFLKPYTVSSDGG